MERPLILDIKGNSLDDGPGIRTVVFLKGCTLDCIWCHNPEGKSHEAQLFLSEQDCIGCSSCVKACAYGAMKSPGQVDRSNCVLCFRCSDSCPSKALKRIGNPASPEQVAERCLSDKPFFDVSGGGVTLSGGEPAMYPQWCGKLAEILKKKGVSVYLETAGNVPYGPIRTFLLPYLDGIYYDLKLMDPAAHQEYCGSDNSQILENFRLLAQDVRQTGTVLVPRTPLVPGITDTNENLEAAAAFISENGICKAQLLPYNPSWYPKASGLGLETDDRIRRIRMPQDEDMLRHCREIFRRYGIEC